MFTYQFNIGFRDLSVVGFPKPADAGVLISQGRLETNDVWSEQLSVLGLGSEISRMLCYDGRRPQLNDLHAHHDEREINFPVKNFH